jgi:prolyl oligopeptidase
MKKYFKLLFFHIVIFMIASNLYSQTIDNLIAPQIVKDTFYGKVYEDPYRFMEDVKNPKVLEWLHKQSGIAFDNLNKISNRENILAKQKEIKGEKPKSKYLKITENDFHFYLKKEVNENIYKLILRKGFDGEEELLFSPDEYKKESGSVYAINYIQPSWDGSKIAIGFTKNGEEFSEIIVLDVETKKTMYETITNCWPSELGGVSWSKDNSGFYYLHIPVIEKSSENYILNTVSVFYELGSDPKKLNTVFSAKKNTEINIKPADFPIIDYKPWYGNILIGRIGGASTFSDYYYAELIIKTKN